MIEDSNEGVCSRTWPRLRVDHVAIGGRDLSALRAAFEGAGLQSVYGGPHANGATHMALIPFANGSYIELISTRDGAGHPPVWRAHIEGDGGPCGWAIEVDDVAAEVRRLKQLGIPVSGPIRAGRRRPDGVITEWDVAYPGDHEAGAVLPFLIKDETPRAYRVPPRFAPAVAGVGDIADPTGISLVVLAVKDLAAARDMFRSAFGWGPPEVMQHPDVATLAFFPGTPVILATPDRSGSWLAERLERFGESPCALVIGARDPDALAKRMGVSQSTRWFGRNIAWIDPDLLCGATVGIVSCQDPIEREPCNCRGSGS